MRVMIDKDISEANKEDLLAFLIRNKNVFAWNITNLEVNPPIIIENYLDVIEGYKHVKKNKRVVNAKKHKVIREEVEKLHNSDLSKM